jgi:hypothetical protein
MNRWACASRYTDGRIAELLLDNCKAGSAVSTLVRDSAIILSLALQHGADLDAIRKSLCRDSDGHALGPVGQALDLIAED